MENRHITGIIGYPLSHTLSPIMHNAVFKKYKMPWEYRVYETKPEDLGAMIKSIRKQGIRGLNVTIPYKQAVMKYLHKIDRAAAEIGAVNTIVNKRGRLTGYNTDYLGFGETLRRHNIRLKGKTVVLLGAGGAAYALAYTINRQRPLKLYIFNIDVTMIHRLVKKLGIRHAVTGNISKTKIKDGIFSSADIIINATSVGQHDDNVPYKMNKIKKGAIVYDIIYNPAKTAFLRHAEKNGAKIINGLEMLIYQGMHSFRLWTGRESDHDLILNKLKKALR